MPTAPLSKPARELGSRRREAQCPNCQCPRLFRKSPIHWAHETATILTLGLWSIVWAAVAVRRMWEPWRCSFCGAIRLPAN